MIIPSQKRRRPDTSCGFYQLDAKFTIKSYQAYRLHQIASSLGKSDLFQLDICRLAATCWTTCIELVDKSLDNQFASSLLTTCSTLVIIRSDSDRFGDCKATRLKQTCLMLRVYTSLLTSCNNFLQADIKMRSHDLQQLVTTSLLQVVNRLVASLLV